MSRLATRLRLALSVIFLGGVWLTPLIALAQVAAEGEEKAPKSYVLGYALTILCVGLGLFVVVRPGKRRYPKIKRKDDDEDAKPHH